MQGRMVAEARNIYHWPNMNIEIGEVARSCLKCIQNAPTNQLQPQKLTLGSWPGHLITYDPFQIQGCKKTFLGIADSFSGFVCQRWTNQHNNKVPKFLHVPDRFKTNNTKE